MLPRSPEYFAYSALRRGQIRVLHSRLVKPQPLPGLVEENVIGLCVTSLPSCPQCLGESVFWFFPSTQFCQWPENVSLSWYAANFLFPLHAQGFSKVTLLFLAYCKSPKGSHTLFFYDTYLLIPCSKVGCVSTLWYHYFPIYSLLFLDLKYNLIA